MYQELHRWDECIAVAQAKVPVLSFAQLYRTQFHQHQKLPFVKEAAGAGLGLGPGPDMGRGGPRWSGGLPLLLWDWRSSRAGEWDVNPGSSLLCARGTPPWRSCAGVTTSG